MTNEDITRWHAIKDRLLRNEAVSEDDRSFYHARWRDMRAIHKHAMLTHKKKGSGPASSFAGPFRR